MYSNQIYQTDLLFLLPTISTLVWVQSMRLKHHRHLFTANEETQIILLMKRKSEVVTLSLYPLSSQCHRHLNTT